jgi:RNA polymerase sigma factor (sigma-70 family)
MSHSARLLRHPGDDPESESEKKITASDPLTEQFEAHRTHLLSVAYRMLGSVSESEDAVQETWLRLNNSSTKLDNLGGWLTTVVARICLDMLRTRRARREDYVGSWLPEPILTIDENSNPEQQALIADSVSLALLVVLEALTPAERLAFVLHDLFAVPFDEIGSIIDRTPTATRQLASRARRTIRGATPREGPDPSEQQRVLDAFLAAARDGDFDALVAILDPNVVFRLDSGPGTGRAARPPIHGAPAVAHQLLARGARIAPLARLALVNGGAGFFVGDQESPRAVVGLTISGGLITDIDLITDPQKLSHIRLTS